MTFFLNLCKCSENLWAPHYFIFSPVVKVLPIAILLAIDPILRRHFLVPPIFPLTPKFDFFKGDLALISVATVDETVGATVGATADATAGTKAKDIGISLSAQ